MEVKIKFGGSVVRDIVIKQLLIQEQTKIKIQNKEKICKDNSSEYKKFLNLGFPKTAIQKFKNCMKEK